MKNLVKTGLLSAFLFAPVFLNAQASTCTLTTAEGTDWRCFKVNGEFTCLERDEDTSCFVDGEGGPIPE